MRLPVGASLDLPARGEEGGEVARGEEGAVPAWPWSVFVYEHVYNACCC